MRLLKNIIANVIGKLWSFVSIFLFIPLYVKILGIESYSIIAFYTVLQTFLTLVDVGLAATLNREFAKTTTSISYKANLLRTFEYINILLAGIICCCTFIFARQIASEFLNADTISTDNLTDYIRLMGLIVGCNIFVSLYQGGMAGLQKQVAMNTLQIVFNTIKAGGVIIPLYFCNSLYTYFYWQLGCTILFCCICRYVLSKFVMLSTAKPHFEYMKSVWRYTAGMILMAVIYAANTQIDKLAVGSLLSLTNFGYYFLAATVGQAVLLLVTPLGIAFLPELTRLFSSSDHGSGKQLYHIFSFWTTSISSGVSAVLLVYTIPYVAIWQQNIQIAENIASITRIFVVSFFFLSVQLAPYQLALANGHTRTNVITGMITITLLWPGICSFVYMFGLIGAAIPRLIISFITTFILSAVIIRKFLKGEFRKWLLEDTMVPVIVSFIVTFLLYHLFLLFPQGYLTIVYGTVIGGVIIFFHGIIFIRRYPDFKTRLMSFGKSFIRYQN